MRRTRAIYKLRTPIYDALNVSWIFEAFCQMEPLNSYTTPQVKMLRTQAYMVVKRIQSDGGLHVRSTCTSINGLGKSTYIPANSTKVIISLLFLDNVGIYRTIQAPNDTFLRP